MWTGQTGSSGSQRVACLAKLIRREESQDRERKGGGRERVMGQKGERVKGEKERGEGGRQKKGEEREGG